MIHLSVRKASHLISTSCTTWRKLIALVISSSRQLRRQSASICTVRSTRTMKVFWNSCRSSPYMARRSSTVQTSQRIRERARCTCWETHISTESVALSTLSLSLAMYTQTSLTKVAPTALMTRRSLITYASHTSTSTSTGTRIATTPPRKLTFSHRTATGQYCMTLTTHCRPPIGTPSR